MKHCFIYTLSDPLTNQIKYVGKTISIAKRFKHHMNENRNNTHKEQWISGLIKRGHKPIIEVIDIVPIHEWQFWESWWISILRSWNCNLTNIGMGGEGGNMTQEIKNKISQSKKGQQGRLGKTFTKEQRERMSMSLKGRKLSTEHIANKAKGCFKYIDLNQLKIYHAMGMNYTEIGQNLNLSRSKIYRTLKQFNILKPQH